MIALERLFFFGDDMTEAELAKITRHLLQHSGLVHWRVTNGAVLHSIGKKTFMKKSEIAGFPDWAGVTPGGIFWALELKSASGRVSPEQMSWMEKLTKTHAIVGIARKPEDVLDFIEICGGKAIKLA